MEGLLIPGLFAATNAVIGIIEKLPTPLLVNYNGQIIVFLKFFVIIDAFKFKKKTSD